MPVVFRWYVGGYSPPILFYSAAYSVVFGSHWSTDSGVVGEGTLLPHPVVFGFPMLVVFGEVRPPSGWEIVGIVGMGRNSSAERIGISRQFSGGNHMMPLPASSHVSELREVELTHVSAILTQKEDFEWENSNGCLSLKPQKLVCVPKGLQKNQSLTPRRFFR